MFIKKYLLFQNKENRDKKFKELKSLNNGSFNFKRSSITNQLIHPQYVEDFEGSEKSDVGLGNIVYKTHFPKLYKIEYNFLEDNFKDDPVSWHRSFYLDFGP